MSRATIRLTPCHTALIRRVAELESASFSQPLSESAALRCTKDPYRIYALTDGALLLAYTVVCTAGGEAQILSIASAQKRRGHARALLNECVRTLRAEGVQKIHLEVRASNTAAQRLYDAVGFRLLGRRKNLYQMPAEDGLIYCLDDPAEKEPTDRMEEET